MLDMKFVRENPEKVIEAVHNRNGELNLDEFLALDKERREVTQQVEVLKNERNTASKEIGKLKKAGESAEEKMAEVRAIGDKIAADDARLREIEARLKEIMLSIPNVPADDCPIGKSDADNPEVRKWGEPRKFDFEPLSHWDKFPAPGLRCTKVWVPVWNGPLSISIWTCIPPSTDIRNFSRPLL